MESVERSGVGGDLLVLFLFSDNYLGLTSQQQWSEREQTTRKHSLPVTVSQSRIVTIVVTIVSLHSSL